MDAQIGHASALASLEQVARKRQSMAEQLETLTQTLRTAEAKGAVTSGKLELEQPIDDLNATSKALKQGVFRVLVLGDVKRGKSTVLNALLGENLLPSALSPCTALLTVLRYGTQQQVTIHFNDDRAPEVIDIGTYKQRYTIDAAETKTYEDQQQLAFPTVSHAVIDYPLPLLAQGIELIDTPGLNDTEARNQLSLGYVNTCQAIVFVLGATQPMTLDERRYLNNYLKHRGLTLFFVINGWDQVASGLADPDDAHALQDAEAKLRAVFQVHLAEYCQLDNQDVYAQRVFEVSALKALRARLQDSQASSDGTGLPEFLAALTHFLTHDRFGAETQRALMVARRVSHQVQAGIERRISLLDHDLPELKLRMTAVQAEFEKLEDIHRQFQDLVRVTGEHKAREIADSFKAYILNLETTFETDFSSAQPDLNFAEFLDKSKRTQFHTAFKRAFERYMNDRLAAWEFIARQTMTSAFNQLNQSAADYQVLYDQVIEAINQELLGDRFAATNQRFRPDKVSIWADIVSDLFLDMPDNMNDSIRPFNTFWQTVLLYACISAAMILVRIFFFLAFDLLAIGLLGAGILAAQAEYVRQEFIKTTRKEFAKCLPQLAQEQYAPIYEAVLQCFEVYQTRFSDRILTDVKARRAELENLVTQKESHDIHKEQEIQRLHTLVEEVQQHIQRLEMAT
jgi:GTPase SAR1 family protein